MIPVFSKREQVILKNFIRFENVSYSYDDNEEEYGDGKSQTKTVGHVDYAVKKADFSIEKGEFVAIMGPSGCGKSTLMKIIAGRDKSDTGVVSIGHTVKIGYYAQEIGEEQMNPRQRVIDYIRDTAEMIETAEGKVTAARMLENFLFAGEDQYGLLGKLSGGERRRLYLCKVLMEAPNVLILDEPTNDLDISTLQILENYLDTFQGIVIVVSHDRYLINRVSNRILEFSESGAKLYDCGYEQYLEQRDNTPEVVDKPKTVQKEKKVILF